MRSFEECDCVDRSTGCGFDWDEKFKTANRYSLNRMAKEIDRAISGACDICPVMDTCLEDGGRCVDTITEWLVQDNFMYDLCMSKKREVNMARLIDRQAAIDALIERDPNCGIDSAEVIKELPSAQPEPCEDAVSRQRLLSDLKELVAAWKKYPVMAEQIKGVEAAIGYVEAIPSAQPQRMRGRWEPKIDRWGDTLTLTEGYNCSECHAWVDGEYSYCPWCGADMREGEQDEY